MKILCIGLLSVFCGIHSAFAAQEGKSIEAGKYKVALGPCGPQIFYDNQCVSRGSILMRWEENYKKILLHYLYPKNWQNVKIKVSDNNSKMHIADQSTTIKFIYSFTINGQQGIEIGILAEFIGEAVNGLSEFSPLVLNPDLVESKKVSFIPTVSTPCTFPTFADQDKVAVVGDSFTEASIETAIGTVKITSLSMMGKYQIKNISSNPKHIPSVLKGYAIADDTGLLMGQDVKLQLQVEENQSDKQNKSQVTEIDTNKIFLRGETEKPFFEPDETIKFTFTVDFGSQPVPAKEYYLKWTRTGDDGKRISGKEEIIVGIPVFVTTKLSQPGFVRIQAEIVDSKGQAIKKKGSEGQSKSLIFDGGAGVNPEKLQPAATEPFDFDQFWAKQKTKLDRVPLKSDVKKVNCPGAKVDVFAVSIACAGERPVTGYLTIPADAKNNLLPAWVTYQGYGTHIQCAPESGPADRIQFNINAHGYDLTQDDAYYQDFFYKIKSNGQEYVFDPKQNANPEIAYFNGMALRVMRSLQFVKTLAQWDCKNLMVSGGSQGGLQAIWAAALDPDVTSVESVITWCCDFAGPTKGRLGGWRPGYVPGLDYYDPVFHAKRIKCPLLISRAGLGDYVCPPSGLAILYNNANAPKKIVWVQGSTHGFVPHNPQKFVIEDNQTTTIQPHINQ